MKKLLKVFAAAVLLVAAIAADWMPAGALGGEPPSWKNMDKQALASLLQHGELTSVDNVGPDKIEMCSVGILANAPPEKVWEVITDFDGYAKLMPDMSVAQVVGRGKDTATVHFTVTVLKVSLIAISTQYTLKYKFNAPRRADISWVSGDVKNVNGYWELFPVDGGKKTVVIYAITSDLASANKLVGAALKEQPATVMAVNLSSAIVLTRLVAKKAETL
jgi:coenzyme Q-binding protein COQ10